MNYFFNVYGRKLALISLIKYKILRKHNTNYTTVNKLSAYIILLVDTLSFMRTQPYIVFYKVYDTVKVRRL